MNPFLVYYKEIIENIFNCPDEKKELSKLNLIEKLTCLEFAVSAEMRKFTSHSAAQKCFKLFWAGELLPIEEQTFNTWPKVLLYFLSL